MTNAESLEHRLCITEYEEPSDFKYIIIKVRWWRLDQLFVEFPKTNRYEATRRAWKIRPKSTKEYPYAFSVTDGIVREIYKINDWFDCENGWHGFNGELAPKEISDRFVGKRIPDTYVKKGMASPVLLSKNQLKK